MIIKSNRSEWTKYDYLVIIKRFFRWINKGKDPEYTEWIKPRVKNDYKLPEEMLTEAEIKQMIEAAVHPRDKALIATFWDAGGRTGEIGELKIKHIVFDKYGAIMIVDGKTGMRRVRLIFSAPYLASWLDIHPEKHNPDTYVWVGIG
jgi:integrase/recombinase XerD